MAVAIHEARENGLAFHVDDFAVLWKRNVAAMSDALYTVSLDNNHRVFNGWFTIGVDEGSAENHETQVFSALSAIRLDLDLETERFMSLPLPSLLFSAAAG